MELSEKVKKGLETCENYNLDECAICPYGDMAAMDCAITLKVDALAYIRELEARLGEANKTSDDLRAKLAKYEKPLVPLKPMTLDEAYEADYCYIEDNVKGSSEPHVVFLGMMTANSRNEKRVEIMEFGEDVDYCVKLSCEAYGKTWRCWSRRPTEEERKAAEWDEVN